MKEEPHSGMRKEIALVCLDLLACAASVICSLFLRFGLAIPWEHSLAYLYFWPILFAWRLLMAYAFRLYDFRYRLTMPDHAFAGCGAALAGVVPGYLFIALMQLYGLPLTRISRLAVLLDALLMMGWFATSRGAMVAWLRRRGYRVRVLAAGARAACEALLDEIRAHAPRLVEAVGIVTHEGEAGAEVLGRWEDLGQLVATRKVDQVVLAEPPPGQEALRRVLEGCEAAGAEVYLYPSLDTAVLVRARVYSIAGLPLVSLNPAEARVLYAIAKRALDVAVATGLLLVSVPVLALAAVAIRATSPGPVLYTQARVGRAGRPFRIWKLRTMVVEAEFEGPRCAAIHDPRVTAAGRWLRRWRIDEIPQLWNVLRGEMSLVGPRPERPEFAEQFQRENPMYARRFLVRPGLTGPAQTHGRYDTDYAHKLRFDLMYIHSASLVLDIRILLATIQTVLTGRGAL